MGRKSAQKVLREALLAHRLETLAALVDREAELTGRVLDAAVVREKLVLTLFAKWPEPGCLSIWFAQSPAALGLPEEPEAWVGRVVRVRGVIRPGTVEQTFWVAVNTSSQIEILAEEPVTE